jgi:hypothetical protein
MIKACRFPVKEILLNIPPGYDFFVDSITTAAYNSEEIESYALIGPEIAVPANSDVSEYDYGLEESSGDEDDEETKEEVPEEAKTEEKKKEKKVEVKKPKVKKESLELHGFDHMQLGAYPAVMNAGDIPNHLLHEKLDGKFENLGMIRETMAAVFDKGKLFPTLHQTQMCYEAYCADFRTTPI